jgi:hypothetical protein
LHFEEFEATIDPELQVLLVENIATIYHDAIGDYVDLGSQKANIGNQNYEIVPDVDLSQYVGWYSFFPKTEIYGEP